jgi:hypothetical protein
LGETTDDVIMNLANAGIDASFAIKGEDPMYLSLAAMQRIVGVGTSVVPVSTKHCFDKDFGEFVVRFRKTIDEIVASNRGSTSDVMVITHGAGVGVLGNILAHPVVISEVDYCGMIVVDDDLRRLLHSDSVVIDDDY